MAAGREKRSTAGNRMSKLIAEEEDEDDFYKTTYGGFNEEASDHDYDSNASDSDDVIDSDFDIDEADELKSDLEDDEPKAKRKRPGVYTKSYKEPKKKTDEELVKEKKRAEKRVEEKKEKSTVQIYHYTEKKSLRRSTAKKSEAAEVRKKEREERTRMMKEIAAKKNVPEVRRLTQAELLAEAKITERENKKSLEDYQAMELEKKKSRITKQVYRGPIIRYHSVGMPLVDEMASPEIDVDSTFTFERSARQHARSKEKCARTFITFTEEKNFVETFPQRKYKVPIRQYCPVTRLPAKYFDPVTQTPYATAQAFRCIRDAYNQHIQLQLEKRKQQQSAS